MKSKMRQLSVLALVLSLSALAYNGHASAMPTPSTSLSGDCVADNGGFDGGWAYEDALITVTLTNCDTFEKYDSSWNVIDSGPVTSPLTVTAGEYWTFFNTAAGGYGFSIGTDIVYDETVPAGELLFTEDIEIPEVADEFNIGSIDQDDEHFLGGKRVCGMQADGSALHVYGTLEITVVKSGVFTFRNTATDPETSYFDGPDNPISDPFLALYDTFDPSNPDDGVIGCNDDLNDKFGYDDSDIAEELADGTWMEGHLSYFSTRLQPGQYTLVLSTWEEVSSAEWSAGANVNYSWTAGAVTATFELWGPSGSMCIGFDPNCDPDGPTESSVTTTIASESTLPATGTSSERSVMLALIAMAIGVMGFAAVRRRHI